MAHIPLYFPCFMVLMCHVYCQKRIGRSVELKKLEKCTEDEAPFIDFNLYKNDEGNLAFKMKVNYDYDVDDSYKIDMKLKMYKNSEWSHYISTDDRWCKLQEAFPEAWSVLREMIQPPLTEANPCDVAGGEYTLENFQASKEDALPLLQMTEVGEFRATLNVYYTDSDGAKEDIVCIYTEFEIKG